MEEILNSFALVDSIVYFKIIFTVILCGIIGLERELHGKPAGLRTHILIGTGACAAMLLAILYIQHNPELRLDPFRIAAGVITGIGFLGAGAIIKDPLSAKGLASAANIWLTASLGLLVAVGYYSIALLITIIIIMTFVLLSRSKAYIEQSGKKCKIEFTIKGELPEKKHLEKVLHKYKFTTVRKAYEKQNGHTKISFFGRVPKKHNIYEILEHINTELVVESSSVSEI